MVEGALLPETEVYGLPVTWLSRSQQPRGNGGCMPCVDVALQEVNPHLPPMYPPLGAPSLQLGQGSKPAECKVTRKVTGRPARTASSSARYVPLPVLPL